MLFHRACVIVQCPGGHTFGCCQILSKCDAIVASKLDPKHFDAPPKPRYGDAVNHNAFAARSLWTLATKAASELRVSCIQ